jgi:hypothetical protein
LEKCDFIGNGDLRSKNGHSLPEKPVFSLKTPMKTDIKLNRQAIFNPPA